MTNVTDTASLGGPSRPSGRRGRRRLALILVAILAVLAVVITGGAFAYAKQFEGKALPGTTVLGADVSGQTPEEIAALVTEKAAGVTVSVTAGDETHEVALADLGVSVDAEGTARAAVEHDESFTGVLASSWSGERAVAPLVTVDDAVVTEYAKGLVPADENQPVDAQVVYDEDAEEWSTVPGTDGRGIDPQPLVDAVHEQAASLTSFSVDQPIEQIAPAITTEEADTTLGEITALLEQPMAIQGAEGETHEISAKRRSSWLSVGPDETGQALAVTVDEEAVREWVADRADDDTVKAKDGIEQVDAEGATVKVVSEKKDGLEITNTDAVADQVIASLTGTTPLEAAFETQTVEAKVEKVNAPTEEETAAADPSAATGEKWIDVDLTKKTVTAYVGSTPVWGPRSMVDGKSGYETVTGSYEIYLRYDEQDMTNASRYPVGHEKYYYTEDVPWVQYFYRGYAFHGAPWRSSFGYSGSHGCINMPTHEAKWLYDWAGIGTRVESHY